MAGPKLHNKHNKSRTQQYPASRLAERMKADSTSVFSHTLGYPPGQKSVITSSGKPLLTSLESSPDLLVLPHQRSPRFSLKAGPQFVITYGCDYLLSVSPTSEKAAGRREVRQTLLQGLCKPHPVSFPYRT